MMGVSKRLLNSQEAEMRDRLKASELLGTSEAGFVDRKLHEGGLDVGIAVNTPAKPTVQEWQEVTLNE